MLCTMPPMDDECVERYDDEMVRALPLPLEEVEERESERRKEVRRPEMEREGKLGLCILLF